MLAQCFGTKMDMLNFQWICRAKKYYNLSEGDIYALIIPIQYHVTKKEIQTMAQAENMEQVYGVIKNRALEMRQRSLQIRSMSLPAGKSLIQQQY